MNDHVFIAIYLDLYHRPTAKSNRYVLPLVKNLTPSLSLEKERGNIE
jgi:hypothetical protein